MARIVTLKTHCVGEFVQTLKEQFGGVSAKVSMAPSDPVVHEDPVRNEQKPALVLDPATSIEKW
jgi:hypothetical protein